MGIYKPERVSILLQNMHEFLCFIHMFYGDAVCVMCYFTSLAIKNLNVAGRGTTWIITLR